ncbi:MAG: hypothetical protein ABTQ25_13220, partial [Nitrosomonas ureae]
VNDVVDRLGYEQRIQMDVKAGLKARIGSLLIGGKGLMFNTRRSIPMKEILAYPTVLELEKMGNEDEKAFVLGLVLTRLYEYRQLQFKSQSLSSLQHLTVFEEAHRLLKNVSTHVETENANTRGQAVETFANMISEIRAYGEGLLIAEQSPTKLAPDALKNTNMKLMHRLVTRDEREVMAGAMNLNEIQSLYVTTLTTGQVVAFAEGDDHPYLLKIFDIKGQRIKKHVSDRELKTANLSQTNPVLYAPFPYYFHFFPLVANRAARIDIKLRDYALKVLNHPDRETVLYRYFLSLIEDPDQAVNGYHKILNLVRRVIGRPMGSPYDQQTPQYILLYSLWQWLDMRGQQMTWPYQFVETMQQHLGSILVDIAANYENRQDILQILQAKHALALEQFRQFFVQATQQDTGPYAGCIYCYARCRYRWDILPVARSLELKSEFKTIINDHADKSSLWDAVTEFCLVVSDMIVDTRDSQIKKRIAFCFGCQIASEQRLSNTMQTKLTFNIHNVLNMSSPLTP